LGLAIKAEVAEDDFFLWPAFKVAKWPKTLPIAMRMDAISGTFPVFCLLEQLKTEKFYTKRKTTKKKKGKL